MLAVRGSAHSSSTDIPFLHAMHVAMIPRQHLRGPWVEADSLLTSGRTSEQPATPAFCCSLQNLSTEIPFEQDMHTALIAMQHLVDSEVTCCKVSLMPWQPGSCAFAG